MGSHSNPTKQGMGRDRVYPNGIMPDWVNPVGRMMSRPKGSLFPGPSDDRRTFAQPSAHRDVERRRARNGWAEDITGDPYVSTEPEWSQGLELIAHEDRYAGDPELTQAQRMSRRYRSTHNPGPGHGGDPLNQSGKLARAQDPGADARVKGAQKEAASGAAKLGIAGAIGLGGWALLRRLRS